MIILPAAAALLFSLAALAVKRANQLGVDVWQTAFVVISPPGRFIQGCGSSAVRAVADERARRAELEKVRVEGERMTSEAQAAERRKRRQLWLGAASLLAVTVVGGLATVVAVQRRANAELVS